MCKKKIFISIGKFISAGILAFIILTCFCFFYYNVPVHYEDIDGCTDYIWQADVFYSRGTEGFAWGRTNNEGYMNRFDYSEGQQIDILIMGSSHMEAYQVAADESAASRLGVMLPELTVYNIGISGHDFLKCVCNLEAAVGKYNPAEYVIIETGNVEFSEEDCLAAIDGTIPKIPSHTYGILSFLQKNPCARLMYTQLQNFMKKKEVQSTGKNESAEEVLAPATEFEQVCEKEILLNQLLEKISLTVQEKNAKLIIVYHPDISINSVSGMDIMGDSDSVQLFDRLCQENHILFLDMSSRFLQEYKNGYILPYGFINSSVGEGHLNKYGHEMIADEIYKLVKEGK